MKACSREDGAGTSHDGCWLEFARGRSLVKPCRTRHTTSVSCELRLFPNCGLLHCGDCDACLCIKAPPRI